MQHTAPIATTLTLPVPSTGQELLRAIYSYCLSPYNYYSYYYRCMYRALFGNHSDNIS
ncbi:hypothetical protein [Pontibacter vulgaris]|uniref:hypothetical protein n=1 Tax=Pontibacter vulgaris TaxID=2905679 RepID=UPI001FA7C5F7|nr:hypothetical protein [Pontibacter vulgaris]